MANNKKNQQDQEKGGVNPVVAAVTGAVVGAGVAVALKDKKNREKVKEVLTNVKNQAIGYMEDMQQQSQAKKGKVEKENLLKAKKK